MLKILARSTVLIALGAAVPALAVTNLVTNGSFEAGYVRNTQFGAAYPTGPGPTGWTSASPSAYMLYFDPKTATTVNATTKYTGQQRLWTSFTGASPDGGKFVALDGDATVRGPLSQSIAGLTIGKKYDVSFYWGAAQLRNRSGATTEQLGVGFGGLTQYTPVVPNVSRGFSGWLAQTFTYTAGAATQTLSFLSLGTPNGLPPVAVLDGVSVTAAVPEPATWAMMIGGFGLVGVAARRRAQRRASVTA